MVTSMAASLEELRLLLKRAVLSHQLLSASQLIPHVFFYPDWCCQKLPLRLGFCYLPFYNIYIYSCQPKFFSFWGLGFFFLGGGEIPSKIR